MKITNSKRLVKNGWYKTKLTIFDNGDKDKDITISSGDIRFFRYRPINDYTISALMRHEFWASQPVTFNDPYDWYVTFNPKKVFLASQKAGNIEQSDLLKDNKFLSEVTKLTTDIVKKSVYITSLSETVENTTMWAHYANNGSGFAVEYSYDQLEDIRNLYISDLLNHYKITHEITDDEISKEQLDKWYKLNSILLPVEYSLKGQDFTKEMLEEIENPSKVYINSKEDFLEHLIDINNDVNYKKNRSMRNYLAISKNSNWKYEREWRMVVSCIEVLKEHTILAYSKPKGIYIGEFIKDSDKLLICLIAKEMDITLYKMYTKYTKTARKLKYKKMTNDEINDVIELKNEFHLRLRELL